MRRRRRRGGGPTDERDPSRSDVLFVEWLPHNQIEDQPTDRPWQCSQQVEDEPPVKVLDVLVSKATTQVQHHRARVVQRREHAQFPRITEVVLESEIPDDQWRTLLLFDRLKPFADRVGHHQHTQLRADALQRLRVLVVGNGQAHEPCALPTERRVAVDEPQILHIGITVDVPILIHVERVQPRRRG